MKLISKKAILNIIASIFGCFLVTFIIFDVSTKDRIIESRQLLKIAQLLEEQKYAEAEQAIAYRLQLNILNMGSFSAVLTGKEHSTRILIDEVAGFYEANGGFPNCFYTDRAEETIAEVRKKLNKQTANPKTVDSND